MKLAPATSWSSVIQLGLGLRTFLIILSTIIIIVIIVIIIIIIIIIISLMCPWVLYQQKERIITTGDVEDV